MKNNKITFPSIKDIIKISSYYDFLKFKIVYNEFKETNEVYEIDIKIKIMFSNSGLKMDLMNKISGMYRSFVFLIYYFEKEIPDDEYLVSPGNDGESISYYPDFTENNFIDKSSFDFYTDFFYFKLFSSFDSLCHIINLLYQITTNKKEIGFNNKFFDKLKMKNKSLAELLFNILDNDDFKRAKEIRNNITHNFSPNQISTTIEEKIEDNKIIGVITHNKYFTSKDIKENVYKSLGILYQALELFFEKSLINNKK